MFVAPERKICKECDLRRFRVGQDTIPEGVREP
jgi:hypothetical protein